MVLCMKRHMVISDSGTGLFYYVISVRGHSMSLLQLQPTADEMQHLMNPKYDSIISCATVTDLETFRCHTHTLELYYGKGGVSVAVRLDSNVGEQMLRFCCLNFLDTLNMHDLRRLAKAVGAPLPKLPKHIDLAEALLDHVGVNGDVREKIVDAIATKLAKRSRRATTTPAGNDEDGEEGAGRADPRDDECEDSEKEEVLVDNPFVRSLPEEEVAFAFNEVPAGFALDEEEGDEGLDAIAAAAAAPPMPIPPRARKPKTSMATKSDSSTAPSASMDIHPSSSSSSSNQPPLPPPAGGPLLEVAEHPVVVEESQGDVLHDEPQGVAALPQGDVLHDEPQGVAGRLAADFRVPNLSEEEAPPGCNLRSFLGRHGEGYRWQAKLPPKAPPFEGTRSKSMPFRVGESGDRERLVCLQYLRRWWATQAAGSS